VTTVTTKLGVSMPILNQPGQQGLPTSSPVAGPTTRRAGRDPSTIDIAETICNIPDDRAQQDTADAFANIVRTFAR
jgi:hypothetical protein